MLFWPRGEDLGQFGFLLKRLKMEDESPTSIFNALDEAYDSESSDSEVDEEKLKKSRKHKALLNDISAINGKPSKRVTLRSEPGTQVDEHLWTQSRDGSSKVKLQDLLHSVPQSSKLGSLKKKIEKLEKSQNVLDAPLSKPQKEKIQRTIAFKENAHEISKWAPTVIKNREAENLSFPLNAYEAPEFTTKSVAVNFKPRTSLEKEIAAVLKGSAPILERKNKELTEEEEKALQAVDLQEAVARRKELQKMRALQSYYELKCKRLKKIKSKKYRKVLRKSQQKKEEKRGMELTEGEKSEVATEVEKNRVMERAHLRHRNTSKWAKKLMTKENKSVELCDPRRRGGGESFTKVPDMMQCFVETLGESRRKEKQLLHDQLQVSRQLTEQKIYEDESDDKAEKPTEDEGFSLLQKSLEDPHNPWLLGKEAKANSITVSTVTSKQADDADISSGTEEDSSPEKAVNSDQEWDEAGERKRLKTDSKKKKERAKHKIKETVQDDMDSEEEFEHVDDIAVEENDSEQSHGAGYNGEQIDLVIGDTKQDSVGPNGRSSDKLKPGSFLVVESKALDVDTFITDISDVDFSKSTEQQLKVREAFANDAVMEEFETEKQKTKEKRQPKDIDLTLPGWGTWGGAAIDNEKILRKKRRKLVKKADRRKPAKDDNLKHVIINEERNKKFTSNQISSLPFPFASEAQFERSIRQPLGKTWNTPSGSAKLTQPKVSTLIGTIIDPIKKTKEIEKVDVSNLKGDGNFISCKRKFRKK